MTLRREAEGPPPRCGEQNLCYRESEQIVLFMGLVLILQGVNQTEQRVINEYSPVTSIIKNYRR